MVDEKEDDRLQVWLSVHDPETSEKPLRTDVILTNDEEGIKFLFTLFKIIKNELGEIEVFKEDTVLKHLKIYIAEFDKKGDLTETLKKKIRKLERYKFYRSSDLIEISGEEIIERMKLLRSKKIKLWKEIFKSYDENKEEFNIKLAEYFKSKKFN